MSENSQILTQTLLEPHSEGMVQPGHRTVGVPAGGTANSSNTVGARQAFSGEGRAGVLGVEDL